MFVLVVRVSGAITVPLLADWAVALRERRGEFAGTTGTRKRRTPPNGWFDAARVREPARGRYLDIRQHAYSCCRTSRHSPLPANLMSDRADLLQGTLDLLILKAILPSPLHGWGISKRIRELSYDVLQVNQGSLYPALYRLEDRGLVRSSWGVSPEGRRAKFYTLTAAGKKKFAEEKANWRLFTTAVEQILHAT
jgi:PadR family transcriptional regulator PadR